MTRFVLSRVGSRRAAVLVFAALLIPTGAAWADDAAVPQWAVHEVRLTAVGAAKNPYRELGMTAEFAGPGGATRTVSGFWAGGATFVVRFTPTAEGEWTYRTKSADAGLNGRTGKLRCATPAKASRGFLRRDDAHPHHFVRDDGSHPLLFGTTYYDLLANLRGDGTWEKAVDGAAGYGINKVRFKACVCGGKSHGAAFAATSPYGTTHDELNLDHFAALDEAVKYMADKGVIVNLILLWNDDRNFGTPEQDERYLRYLIARYAAYPNVIFCLSNEWEYTKHPLAYWNRMGKIARAEDPWAADGKRVRALSIHQRTRIGWQFADQDWPGHVVVQYGVRNPGGAGVSPKEVPRYAHGDQWGYEAVRFNWGCGKPVINDEYSYAGDPNDPSALRADGGGKKGDPMTRAKHRQVMWGTYLAGGYGSTGDKSKHGASSDQPYFTANWYDIDEYGDIKRLVEFFTAAGVQFWRLSPDHDRSSAANRVYVLGEPGRCYVVYATDGGKATVQLDDGKYRGVRFNPRTGKETAIGQVTGEMVFDSPAGDDWVFRLDAGRRTGFQPVQKHDRLEAHGTNVALV